MLLWATTHLQAQKSDIWADSTLDAIATDASKEKYIDTLLKIYQKNGDDCKWIRTVLHKYYSQALVGKFKEALQSITQAENKYRQAACKNKVILPKIYLAYSNLYIRINETEKANYYAQLGIDIWPSESIDKKGLIHLYLAKGDVFTSLDSQMTYFKKAYGLAKKIADLKLQEECLNRIGVAYAMQEKNDSAIVYLKKALQIDLKRKDYGALSSLYNNLAGLSTDYKFVDNYLDSSFYYAKLSGNLVDQQAATQNRALFYYQNGKYQEGYDKLWESTLLKDSLFNLDKINAFAEMEQKYESEKKTSKITQLQQENLITELKFFKRGALNFGLGAALIGLVIISIVFYIQNRKKQKLNIALKQEKQKSDNLLLNILPEVIAEELKENGKAEAKLIDEVTVLFTDFKDFTNLTKQLQPSELVSLIDFCFKKFDNIISGYNIEKIKTIGDSYMCAGGLPVPNHTNALEVVNAALEINRFVLEYSEQRISEGLEPIGIRIGIHTGPVVAGIVGIKKFAYDIWGDTVNTASRLESSCEVNRINISETTHELISDLFTFEYRGKILAKHKGELDMYYVLGPVKDEL